MVSFQCDGCSDVVKKPKLDQHGARCHASFTCIDCSTTFNGPAQYKGHTSCISEAEKYQKSLYKGPKTQPNQQNNRGGPRDNSYTPQNNYPRNGASNGNGMYQQPSQGRYLGNRMVRVTGANETPLGTPLRMSPVDPSPVPEPKQNAVINNAVKEGGVTGVNGKEKKRKVEDVATQSADEPRKKKTKASKDVTAVDPPSVPLPPSSPVKPADDAENSGNAEKKDKGKKKKDKRDKKGKGGQIEVSTTVEDSSALVVENGDANQADEVGKEGKKEKKSKAKKEKAKSVEERKEEATGEPGVIDGGHDTKRRKEKKRKSIATEVDVQSPPPAGEKVVKDKKEKRDKDKKKGRKSIEVET